MSDWQDRSGFAAAQRAYDYQEPPGSSPIYECCSCGIGILGGEKYYEVNGLIYCASCNHECEKIAEVD